MKLHSINNLVIMQALCLVLYNAYYATCYTILNFYVVFHSEQIESISYNNITKAPVGLL